MPKELTHWLLADRAASALHPESRIRQLLEENRDAWLIGAVLPDTLLHLFYGQQSKTAIRLAGRFHDPVAGSSYGPLIAHLKSQGQKELGQGSGTLWGLKVKGQEKTFESNLDPAVTACLLGVAAHMEADIVFHPFVYSQSGNDMALHYSIETNLDLWFLYQGAKLPVLRLKQLLTDRAAAEAAVQVAVGVFDPDAQLGSETIKTSLKLHGSLQKMYGSLPWQLAVRMLSSLPFAGLKSCYNLFYPVVWRSGREFCWPVRWVDKTSGLERFESPEKLAEIAVERILKLLFEVEKGGLLEALEKQPGENLLTGMVSGRQ